MAISALSAILVTPNTTAARKIAVATDVAEKTTKAETPAITIDSDIVAKQAVILPIPSSETTKTRIDPTKIALQSMEISLAMFTGLVTIFGQLQQLQNLAAQAIDPSLSDIDRGAINQQFISALNKIDTTVATTSVRGSLLLDGSFSYDISRTLSKYLFTGAAGQPTPAQAKLQIGNLGTTGLFSSTPDLTTAANAEKALGALAGANTKMLAAFSEFTDFSYALRFAVSNLNVANGGQPIPPATTPVLLAPSPPFTMPLPTMPTIPMTPIPVNPTAPLIPITLAPTVTTGTLTVSAAEVTLASQVTSKLITSLNIKI